MARKSEFHSLSEDITLTNGTENTSGMPELPVLSSNSSTLTSDNSAKDMSVIRERLAEKNGQEYWRSLDELAETAEFKDYVQHEFPDGADQLLDPVSRRGFMKVMGASIALAGVGAACTRQPEEKIIPFVRAPEELIPGKPLFFATAHTVNGYATGILVESHMGRPTKVEGNPDHPASHGATDIYAQASILGLYDPDRSQSIVNRGETGTWSGFKTELGGKLEEQLAKKGAGLRILTETVTSPTLAAQLQKVLAKFPAAIWHQYEPASLDSVRVGTHKALGKNATPVYNLEKADVILSLESDFLSALPGNVHYARQFSARRKADVKGTTMNRLYIAESMYTVTGSAADHRLPLRSRQIEALANAVAAGLGVQGSIGNGSNDTLPANAERWVKAVVKDLKAHAGNSLVVPGQWQPASVHVLAHAINHALGNVGSTVTYIDPVEASPVNQNASLRSLTRDMEAGKVEALVIVGGNPVYNAPADLAFAANLQKVPFRAHLSMYKDETSYLCHWHIPESHPLETWSDARAFDGTASIVQPLIAPLYDSTKSAHEILAVLTGETGTSAHDTLKQYWAGRLPGDAEKAWQKVLHDGVIPAAAVGSSTIDAVTPTAEDGAAMQVAPADGMDEELPQQNAGGMEIVFRPDPCVFDGRYANNGWLQELPKPLTKLTWDNAAYLSPATAEKLSVKDGDVLELKYQGRSVNAPVWILPGHADESITVHLGYGRERVGRVGDKAGFNAYSIRTSDAPWFGSGLQVTKTEECALLVSTQDHGSLEGRNMYREGTLEEFMKKPDFVMESEPEEEYPSIYDEWEYTGYAWGMTIDLNSCIGCNVCTIACQSENNISVVGKEQVSNGREMHWIRVDRYFQGGLDNPTIAHQPVPCMHCEQAPCEVVCPVGATVHSSEGLNDMVYNRCVGTRYCSNNCPYKVRRFNFLLYADLETSSLKLGQNPDVTVRSRGVMEKCTYCVQRINEARIHSKVEKRAIQDGEIVTACQQACPTGAIAFGDINNPESMVSRNKANPRNYGMLRELNTKPRTSYLAKLTNPNPELATAEAAA